MRALLPLAVLSFLATSALAAEETPMVDLVAAIVIGFGPGATAMIGGEDQTAQVVQDGPGSFSGTTIENGLDFEFVVVESSPCVFDGTFAFGGNIFAMRFDAGVIDSIAFETPDEKDGYTRYSVNLEGPEGAVMRLLRDGSTEPMGNRSPIGTSIALADLEAAAATVTGACPQS